MHRRLILSVFAFWLQVGCKELTVSETQTGGSGGAPGSGGAGGSMECIPQAECSTALMGECTKGTMSCSPTATCIPTVQPTIERCDTPDDENCDGKTCVGGHVWSKRFGDSVEQRVEQVLVDPLGNVVVVGRFRGVIDFGNLVLMGDKDDDIFVAKFDPAGNRLWAKKFGGPSWQSAFGATINASGDIILVGSFDGSLAIGDSATATADGAGDAFVAKLDTDGNPQWLLAVPGPGYQGFYSVTADTAKDIVAVGEMTNSIDMGGGPELVAGESDILTMKLGNDGTYYGHIIFGSTAYDGAWSVTSDGQNNTYLTGQTFGAIDFGGGPLLADPNGNGFLVKLNAEGGHVWTKSLQGTGEQYGSAVACDSTGDLVFVFEYDGTVNVGGTDLPSFAMTSDTGIAKFDASGNHLWSNRLHNDGNKTGHFLTAFDALNNILVVGDFNGGLQFWGTPLQAVGRNLFVGKLDPTGKPIWAHAFGTSSAELEPYSAAVGPLGDVFVGGTLKGSTDLGAGALMSAGTLDAFIARFEP